MAFLVLVINCPNDTIGNLNANTQFPTKVDESINGCINMLTSIEGGLRAATVQVTTRDTDPSVSTSGTSSEQFTYNHL
jgi:hypothetical protein